MRKRAGTYLEVTMNGFNFTERVRRVLGLARDEATRLHHEYVGTEHILLGLIREGDGVAAAVLRNLGVDLERVKRKVNDTVTMGRSGGSFGPDLPYTSRAKKVLELAMSEGRTLGNYVGTEHLLIGLLREEKGIAAQILIHYAGITEASVRAEVRRVLKGGGSQFPDRTAVAGVVAVTVAVRFSNDAVVREDFQSVQAAIDFLNRQ